MEKQNGFSLIEMMVVVVIIGILAAIAVPAYQSYSTRGNIADATSGLATKRVQLEQFYQDNRTYVGATVCNLDTTTSKNFNFSCTVQTAAMYTLQALGKGPMAGFTYTIDQSNTKLTTAAPAGWNADIMPATCWITKRNGVC